MRIWKESSVSSELFDCEIASFNSFVHWPHGKTRASELNRNKCLAAIFFFNRMNNFLRLYFASLAVYLSKRRVSHISFVIGNLCYDIMTTHNRMSWQFASSLAVVRSLLVLITGFCSSIFNCLPLHLNIFIFMLIQFAHKHTHTHT